MEVPQKMSALFKRAEQLKRYEDSQTNRESVQPKTVNTRKVKFSSGCIFLASCAAGDKDEVLNLLNTGADIDTANVDGLTALHQVSKQLGNVYVTRCVTGKIYTLLDLQLRLFLATTEKSPPSNRSKRPQANPPNEANFIAVKSENIIRLILVYIFRRAKHREKYCKKCFFLGLAEEMRFPI